MPRPIIINNAGGGQSSGRAGWDSGLPASRKEQLQQEQRQQKQEQEDAALRARYRQATGAGSGSLPSSRAEQILQEQEETKRAREYFARLDAMDRAYGSAEKQLAANERTDKRSQVMLQGFHRDPVQQAASEAELLASQYQRNQQLYEQMGRNATTESRYKAYLDKVTGADAAYQKSIEKYNQAAGDWMDELKKTDRARWYAETMSAEQIREAMEQNKQKQQTAREVLHTTPWSDGLGGSANDKALSVDRRIKELEQEGRDMEQAIKIREQLDYTAAWDQKQERAAEIEKTLESQEDFATLSRKTPASVLGLLKAASKSVWTTNPTDTQDEDIGLVIQSLPKNKRHVYYYLRNKAEQTGDERWQQMATEYFNTFYDERRAMEERAKKYYVPGEGDNVFQKARKVAWYLMDSLAEGTTMAIEQGADALDNIGRSTPKFSNYDTNELLPYAMQQAGDGARGMIFRTLGEAAQSTGRMIPAMAAGNYVGWLATVNPTAVAALGKATHGVISAERAAKGAQNAVFYLTTKGSAMQEGREKGLSGAALEIYSNLSAISEVGLQNAIGGIAQFGGISESQLMKRVAQIDNVLLRTSARFGVQYGGELLEEELQNWLEPGFVTILTGNEYQAPTALEMLETALSTFFMVGSMNAPDTARYYDSSRVRSNLQTLVAGYRDMGGEYAKAAQRIESYIRAMDANPEARFTREDFAAAMDMMGEAEASMKSHDVTPEEIRDALLEETEGEELSERENGSSVTAPTEDGGRPMTAPAEDGGRPVTAPAEDVGRPMTAPTGERSAEDEEIYRQTLRQTVENAAGMDEEMLRSVEAAVAQNLEAMRDSAPAAEIARAEGELEGLRQVLQRWEQVSRNGERLTQAAGPAALTGKVDEFAADWNGSRETEGERILRSAQNDIEGTGERIAAAPAAPRNDTIEGGLNDGEYQQGGRQGAVPTDGQRAERAEQGPADGGQRDAGLGTGGPAGGLGGRAAGSVAGGEGKTELAQLRNQIRALEAERRSAAQIGVNFGTKNENLRVVPEELYTSAMREEQARAEENGVRLTFVAGGAIELRGKGGRIITADGLHQVDADGAAHIFARADSRRFSPEQLTRHEDFHNIVANNRGLLLDMVEALYEEQGEEGVARMVDAYVVALDGCYGVYAEGMDEDAQRELAMLYIEEIFADQYAGMNRSSGEARRAAEAAGGVAQRFAGDIENARQNRAGIERRNGPGTRLAFAGQNAETADLASLDEAKQLLKGGADSETVRQQTGWFQGMDGKWRFEIDDSNMTITLPDSRYSYLRNVVELPGLFEAYPDLADVELLIEDLKDGERGKYNPTFDSISISREIANDQEAVKKTLVHEIQHAIQNREGFTSGASPEYWERELRTGGDTKTRGEKKERTALWREYNSMRDQDPAFVEKMENLRQSVPNEPRGEVLDWDTLESEPDPPAWVEFDKKRDALTAEYGSHRVWEFMRLQDKIEKAERPAGKISGPNELYYSTAGEVEARDVQKRLNYSAETRKNTRPDIDREDVVYSRKGTKSNDGVAWEGNREQRLSVSDKSNAGYESVEHISPREIVPRNDVEKDRMEEVWERAANTTEWQGRPMLAYERAGSLCAITGSHRLAVARLAGYDVDAVILRENELADLEQYLQEETYWDLDDFLERMDEADQADYLNQAVEKGYDSLREAASLMNAEVEWNDVRYSRFSPSEDAGDSWGVDWIGKENGGTDSSPAAQNDRTEATSSASRSEAASPQGEGLETGKRIATAPEAPRNDNEGNGGRPVTAPTEERGRQSAVPTEQSYAEQAREKKVEIARKASADGLKSRIQTAEERLKALKSAERMGLVTEESKRQELQRRIADTQETIDILKAELDRKKAARSAQKADKAARTEAKARRKAEKLEAQKAAELRENRPRQARKEFRQDALNLFSVPAAKRQTLGDLLNRFADKVIHQGSVTEQDRRELFSSLYEAGVETIQGDEYYKQIRDFARGGRIYVPQELRAEFGDDWDAFRKRAWGNGVFLTNDSRDRGADAWNVELAEMFPGSFDAQETDSRTILEGIVELAEEGKAEHVSIEEMMLRNQQETGVSVDEQMDELERKVDQLIDTFAQKAELEVKLRKAGTMQLVKERQKNREIAARQVQRKKENDTRSQVMKQLQQLNRMRKKSAPEIQRQIDEIIGNLDVMARSISPEGLENLQELARKYEEAAEDPNFLGNPYVEQRLARLDKVQLDSLEISDVIELGRTVSALVKSVTEDKRLLTDAREREISDAAEAASKEIRSSEGSKGGKLREFLGNEHLSPTRMIQRLGGWVRGGMMEQLSRALEDGGTRRMDYQRQATRIFDGFVADKKNQEWLRKAQGKDAEWIKVTVPAGITGKDVLSGKDGPLVWQDTTFEITPMMRVGLLMHSKNKDNLRHIKTGGIVIPNKAEYIKGNLAEADARGTRVKLQPEVVRAIVKDCTAQERAFAALLEQYYDGFSKEKINEVSMQIDGFERAGGDHYYGIKVSRKFLAAQPEQIQKNMSLESIGSIVNERVHAGNPIILEDASTALTGHIDLISKYYGYTAAIRDFNAVMNYTFHQKGKAEDGQEYTANAFAGSVKETLGEKWGSGAQKYLDDLLAGLQQKSSINETAAQVMAKLRGNLAAASLTLNPAVALSQTASLPGAVQVLGVDGVIAGLKPEKVDMELVEKYSPVLWYRNQGNSTQELGDYLATKGMGDKLPWWANWIQKMDSWTIRRLWAGAEYRVSKDTDLSPGSKEQIDAGTDAYYQEVARVFQRAVYDTQPNYSEMQRPAILRSKSDLTKALTMYKTVPLQYYNMMYEAVGRLRADAARAKADPNSKQAQAELGKSKAFLAKTFGGILGANVTYVVMKALVKGLLGGKKDKYLDEEGDLDAGKIFGNLGKDLIDTYAGSVIFGSDLLTFGEKLADAITTGKYSRYGGTEISFISAIEDVMGGVYDLATEIHKQDFWGGVGAIKDLAKQIAMVCGIPANNVETYLRGITKLISPEWADRYDNLFDEIERGDLKGQTGRDLRAAFRVLMDNRTDGLKDETVEELLRLWGNGQTVQVPSAVPASISIDGESRNLSADERSRFREIWGKTVSDSLERLIESNGYEQADDIGKAKLIKKLYDYARQQAVEAAVGKEPDAWVLFGQACVAAGVGLEDYLAVAAVGKDKLKAMDGTELDAAIADRMQFRIGEMDGDSLDELGRLFADGASDVIPSDVPTSITVGGQEIKFSPEERVVWLQAWQRTAGESLEAVMGSKAYQAADDAGKERLIAAVFDYARAAACSSVTDSYAPDKWITIGREAESRGIDADEYIIFRQQAKEMKSAEKLDLLKKQSWTEGQKEYIWMASMASEAQLTKYKPLKESGVKWAAALDLLGVGEASTAGMTQEETARYQAAWDRISGPATKKLMANAAYRTADKATQSAYIDKLNAYTTQTAKAETVRGYTPEKWVELGQTLSKAGVALDEYIVYSASTSDARSRDKYAALNKTGWTESQKLEAMAYISESTHRVATVGMDYQVGLSYYLDALANADADQSGNINQVEAEDYIDRLALGWEDKAYLWQMVCASSKWKNNPYSAGMGEEIWHSLHPDN